MINKQFLISHSTSKESNDEEKKSACPRFFLSLFIGKQNVLNLGHVQSTKE
jgi:hypothetical protein